MGRFIDLDYPLSDEDKEFLRSRSRGHQIIENERRFPGGVAEAADELERAGQSPESASFDPDERSQATHDVGGGILPGQILDVDTGRVVPLAARTDGFDVASEEGDNFDDDIVEAVFALKNLTELRKGLTDAGVEFAKSDDKEELQNKLIVGLQDQRDALAPAADPNDDPGEFGDPVAEPVAGAPVPPAGTPLTPEELKRAANSASAPEQTPTP